MAPDSKRRRKLSRTEPLNWLRQRGSCGCGYNAENQKNKHVESSPGYRCRSINTYINIYIYIILYIYILLYKYIYIYIHITIYIIYIYIINITIYIYIKICVCERSSFKNVCELCVYKHMCTICMHVRCISKNVYIYIYTIHTCHRMQNTHHVLSQGHLTPMHAEWAVTTYRTRRVMNNHNLATTQPH